MCVAMFCHEVRGEGLRDPSIMARDPGGPFSLATRMRYAARMRPLPIFIPPHRPLAERLLNRALAHEMRAARLRDLAKLVVEPTEARVGGRGPVTTIRTTDAHRATAC